MKIIRYIPALFLAMLLACAQNNRFSIEGKLPDTSFDGEYIYLVPFENANKINVDSTQIKNGVFHFKGKSTQPAIEILRMRPALRLKLQELLVVSEPGKIKVNIDAPSSSEGTFLNNALQYWKKHKSVFDSLRYDLQEKYKSANDSLQQKTIAQRVDSLRIQTDKFNFNFIKQNRNVVGEMVFRITGNSFSREQKAVLSAVD